MKSQNNHTKETLTTGASSSAWLFSLTFHGAMLVFFVVMAPIFELKPVKEHKPMATSVVYKTRIASETARAEKGAASFADGKPERAPKKKARAAKVHAKPSAPSSSEQPTVIASALGEASNHEGGSERAVGNGLFRAHPQVINQDDVKVPYPEHARQMMIEGIVKMRLTVSEAGRVIDAQILSGPYYGLRNAALMVARKLFFLPATDEQGLARTANVVHEVVFRLNKRS